jgi:hypothetical protein
VVFSGISLTQMVFSSKILCFSLAVFGHRKIDFLAGHEQSFLRGLTASCVIS